MRFVLVHNAHCNHTLWYIKVTDILELGRINDQYVGQYFHTYWEDPHMEAALDKGCPRAIALNPMNILPKRCQAMAKRLCEFGTLYLNKNGGWCVPTEGTTELEEVEQNDWPDVEKSEAINYVTIYRWPMAHHYYLRAWPRTIIFSQEKFNTYEEAKAEALKFVPENRIKMGDGPAHNKFIYSREGD